MSSPGRESKTQFHRIYVGESDQVPQRLLQHHASKEFWTLAVVFTGTLNKAHVQHLETRLLGLAAAAKRCELDNANIPNAAALSEVDRAQAEAFLADMLLILGMSYFEVGGAGLPDASAKDLRLKFGPDVDAVGQETQQGFLVRKHSRARMTEGQGVPISAVNLRQGLVAQNVLAPDGGSYVFTVDYVFASPAMAASVLLGRANHGRADWKTTDGQATLEQIQQTSAGAALGPAHPTT